VKRPLEVVPKTRSLLSPGERIIWGADVKVEYYTSSIFVRTVPLSTNTLIKAEVAEEV
jgi:hypothetical protein